MNPRVLRILRLTLVRPLANVTWESGPTRLRWWQRVCNWIAERITFHDAANYREVKLENLTPPDEEAINRFLFENTPMPRCCRCQGVELDADPAGYYCDADDHRGAPLLCLRCHG